MNLSRFPRLRLAHLPTPLEPLERLTADLGAPRLLVKRDDATGLAFGGNKARKLEFLAADAQAQGADTLITAGGVQSNHARQTAAVAARLGMECDLVLSRIAPVETDGYEVTGNVLLDRLLGARLHFVPGDVERADTMDAIAETLRSRGRRPYVIPVGGSNEVGALGYVAAALELETQAGEIGVEVDAVVHAASSGGTQAGLVVGFHGIRSHTQVIGIDVDADAAGTDATVRGLVGRVTRHCGLPEGSDAAIRVEAGYAGEAYGQPTRAMVEAVTRAARSEGLVLDPVYSGKAMAGLIGLVRAGRFTRDQTVVFLHTGGGPALFAYPGIFPVE